MKIIRLPLHRICGCNVDGVVVLHQEPHETLAPHNKIVIPMCQEVEVAIDESLSGELQGLDLEITQVCSKY